MDNYRRLIILASIVFIGLILVIISSYIPITYTIKGVGCFFSYSDWVLIQLSQGELITRFANNNPPSIRDFEVFQFDRPDFVKFSPFPVFQTGGIIHQNDTIGIISSTENQLRLETLLGELNVAKANLQFLITGEKLSIQDELRKTLAYAKTEYETFEPIVKRKQELLKKKLISAEEVELAETHSQLLRLNIAIAEERLKTVQTGAKPEQIDIVQRQIVSLEKQIKAIERMLTGLVIASPINGIVMGSQGDTMLFVSQLDTMVVKVPVLETDLSYLPIGAELQILVPALAGALIQGTVESIDKNAFSAFGRTMFIARATVKNPDHKLLPGMTGNAKIFCDKIKLLVLLKRLWRTSVGSRFLM